MELTDGVVTLRPPVAKVAPGIAEAVRSSLPSLSEWLPWATPEYSEAAAREWIDEATNDPRHPFLLLDASGRIVGTCGLQHPDPLNGCVQLGYWITRASEGKGLATRGARLAVDHAQQALGFHRVEILISVENLRSQRVAERLGALREARLAERLRVKADWHDAFLYALVS